MKSIARLVGALGVASIPIAAACYRGDGSCLSAARSITRFALTDSVRIASCTRDGSSIRTDVVLDLDSVGVAHAEIEAQRQQFGRIEEIIGDPEWSRSPTNSALHGLKAGHGWYWSSMGKNANGGYTLIVLDTVKRRLTIQQALF